MTTYNIKFLKAILSLSLIVTLLVGGCAQSDKSTSTAPETNLEVKSRVEKPKMDLQAAVMSGDLDVVKQHIEAGTDINVRDQMSGATPLISAATFGKTAIAEALIDAEADLDIKNNDGATVLHTAAFFCRVEIVQLLIDANVDKTIKNNFGATARESVMGSFTDMKPFYEMLQQQLGPFGLQLDLDELEKTRPVVAMMLQ
jgi:ankyrin repeat protein